MRDVWIGDSFDERVGELLAKPDIALHLTGSLKTKGVYRWGQYATRNLGKGWTVDGDAEIFLEPTQEDNQPVYCLAGPAARVSGIRTRGNHSTLVNRWTGSLRTGGVLLEGDGVIDGVSFADFGSHGAETFVGIVTGGSGPAAITNCVYWNHDAPSSNDQVSVFVIMGLEFTPGPLRSVALMEGNQVTAPNSKQVQAHTIYQTTQGLIQHNKSIGADVFVYGDYFVTKGIAIKENVAENCIHGVQLKLSPGASGSEPFSHEDYKIGVNKFESSGAAVSLDTVGPATAQRYIRNIAVDASLSVEALGGAQFNWINQQRASSKGCRFF